METGGGVISALVWISLVLLAARWLDRWEQHKTDPSPGRTEQRRDDASSAYAQTVSDELHLLPSCGRTDSPHFYDWAAEEVA